MLRPFDSGNHGLRILQLVLVFKILLDKLVSWVLQWWLWEHIDVGRPRRAEVDLSVFPRSRTWSVREYQGDMLRRLHYFRNKFEILRSEKVCMVLRLFLSLFLFPLIFIFGYQRKKKYAILGDDIVIEDRHVAELYQEAMEATNGSSTGWRGA